MQSGRYSLLPICLGLVILSCTASGYAQSATRSLPPDYTPGETIMVRIEVIPAAQTTNWVLRDFFPSPWSISSTNATHTNELSGEIVFGPFHDAEPRVFFYSLETHFDRADTGSFNGYLQFNDETPVRIVGQNQIHGLKAWEFIGPQVLQGVTVAGTAHGANRWVATALGWATTTDDGTHWTYPQANLDYLETMSRMTHLHGNFLWWGEAGDGHARMATSIDGQSWKYGRGEPGDPIQDPFSKNGFVGSVAFGDGVYVAVGSHWRDGETAQGAIWRSTNAYHWTRVYRVTADPLVIASNQLWLNVEAVAYGQGQFIAVGAKGMLVSSTNGLDWIQRQPLNDPGNTNSPYFNLLLTGVQHGPSGWIVTSAGAQSVLQSVNGVDWNTIPGNTFPGFATNRKGGFYRSFTADGKYWFTSTARTVTTVDGKSWQTLNLTAVTKGGEEAVPRYLAGNTSGQLLSSSNGVNWNVTLGQSSPGSSDWPNYYVTLTDGQAIWLSGVAAVPAYLEWNRPLDHLPTKNIWAPAFETMAAWISDNSASWGFGGMADDQVLADYLVADQDILAVVGSPRGSDITISAGTLDLAAYDWQGSSLSTLTRTSTNNVKYAGFNTDWGWCQASLCKTPTGFDLYTEAGKISDGRATPTRIRWGHYTSANGKNWTRRAGGLNDTTIYPGIRGLAWGGGRFVAVGTGDGPGLTPTANRIYTSTDGESYSAVNLAALQPSLDGEGLVSVVFGAGKFVAAGNRGRLLFSTNGLLWATAYPPDGKGWNRIRFLNNSWIAVGSAGRTALSSDGVTWTVSKTGLETDLNDATIFNERYIIAGNNGVVLRSIPPSQPAPIILKQSLTRLPDGSFRFSVQGAPNILPVVEASTNLLDWMVVTPAHTAVDASGSITFTDHSATALEQRFYRVSLP